MTRFYLKFFIFFCTVCVFSATPTVSGAKILLDVEVQGLEGPLRQNVLNFLKIEKMKDNTRLTPRWIRRLHEQAPGDIRDALQPFGYYLPEIKSKLTEENDQWMAVYHVDPGEPVKITDRDIRWIGPGADEPVLKQSIISYKNKASEVLDHAEYEAAKSRFLNLALANGYPRASFDRSEVLVDLDTNTARETLVMDTGPLYHFGKVTFEQDFLDPGLLEKYVTLQPGARYSHEALLEFQQNLIASNYAREVTIKPRYDEAKDGVVPITVVMRPIVPHRITWGIGYESDIGPRVSARWTDRLVNRHGHHSNVFVKVSQKESRARVSYSVPVLEPLTDSWVTTAGYDYEETPSTISNVVELETGFVRRNLENTHFFKLYILASRERFTINAEPSRSTTLLTPGGIMRLSEIEDGMYPQNGYSVFVDLRGAAEALLSDTGFTRLHFKGRYLHALGENGRLDTRLETGAAWVNDFDLYPASLRYFAGGDNSVRGYTFQSLGPVDDKGVVVGGKHVLTGSLEYDYRLNEAWVLAGFVDAGNAYDDSMEKVYVGSGFGVRWLAPFGSLRVDFAWPVSEQFGLDDVMLHVGFGATL